MTLVNFLLTRFILSRRSVIKINAREEQLKLALPLKNKHKLFHVKQFSLWGRHGRTFTV
jgi:hypothetical protein